MGAMTPELLEQFFSDAAASALQLTGIEHTEDSCYLGAIGLSLVNPLFHSILGFNFSGILSDSARFYTRVCPSAIEGRDVRVAVFRQFDASLYQDHPEELIAGWVPSAEADVLEGWVAEMNAQIARLLEVKHARAAAPGTTSR